MGTACHVCFNSFSFALAFASNKAMRTITVRINALNSDGAIFALEEVIKQIQDGYTSGLNASEEGEGFSWDSDLQIGD